MRRLTTLLTVLTFTGFMLAACNDSGTGPDPGNDDNGGDETPTYTVNVSAADGGSVSPSGSNEYDEGETVELTSDPNDEYLFSGWTGDVESTDNPLSLTVDQDYSVTANFEKKSYTLTTNTQGAGSVDEQIVSNKTTDYEHGTVVELTANPDTGWEFLEWQGAITGTSNPKQITIDDPKQVTAVFEEKAFKLASNGVTVTCGDGSVGDTGTINGTTYTKRSASQITPGNAPTTCTSGITDMSGMFTSDDNFNGDISHWDVSSVTDMSTMFRLASAFNQDLSNWDVSNVTDMQSMFAYASSFNQDLNNWDVSSVTDMGSMFDGASSFSGDLSGWDVSGVTNMKRLFNDANSFNSDIGNWDVSNVTDMVLIFGSASSFDQDLSSWNVSNVTDMGSMFSEATSFNGDISSWNVSSVTNMRGMFFDANSFNKDLSNWDVSAVTNMSGMFYGADIFNGDVSNWDVSSVTEMRNMFRDAASYNQDISSWCVSQIASKPSLFDAGAGFQGNSSIQPQWGTCPGS